MGAGVSAVVAVVALALLSLFSCLHVSMQLQRAEICMKLVSREGGKEKRERER